MKRKKIWFDGNVKIEFVWWIIYRSKAVALIWYYGQLALDVTAFHLLVSFRNTDKNRPNLPKKSVHFLFRTKLMLKKRK